MSKVTLKVEIDEETYKQIKSDSVCSNNNECIISKSSSAYNALNAIINATPLTESDDCVSRQAVLDALDNHKYSNEFCEEHHIDWSINLGMAHIVINELPPVLPKHEQNVLDKIRAEIAQNAYPIVHGVNNHEKGMTLYGILQIIDKYRKEQTDV